MRRRFASVPKEQEYMIIEALEDALTVSLNGMLISPCVEYSLDGEEWFVLNLENTTPPINKGKFILFKGNYLQTASNFFNFVISTKCNLLGSCMSLLGKERLIKNNTLEGVDRAFSNLFNSCPIVSVSEDFLPATTLSESCYDSMFSGCTSLVNAPKLPAITLSELCYSDMFSGCTSLVNAPALPATTLAPHCYNAMFYNCSKLNYIKMLATVVDTNSTLGWVRGVSETGTFVKNPAMTSLPTGVNGIPKGWTVVDDGADEGMTLDLKGGDNGNAGVQLYEYMFTNSEYDGSFYYWYPTAADNITITHGAFNKAKVTSAYITQRGYTWVLSFEGQGDWVAYLGDDGYLDIYNSMD